MSGIPVTCDFCGDSVEFTPAWAYSADEFTIQAHLFDADGKHVGTEPWSSDGIWAACETCHELIEASDDEKLLDRSWRKNRPRFTGVRRSRKRDAMVREGVAALHEAFWKAKHDEAPRHIEPTPTRQRVLMTEHLLRRFGEKLRADEPLVVRAMEPLWAPDLSSKQEVGAGFLALLRTAAIYQVDDDHAREALLSMPPGLAELPPLPFARVSVELTVMNTVHRQRVPVPWMDAQAHERTAQGASGNVAIPLLGLSEIEQGSEWIIYLPYFIKDEGLMRALVESGRDAFGCAAARLTLRDGKVEVEMPVLTDYGKEMAGVDDDEEQELYEETSRVLASRAINAAHLITAQKVPTHKVPLPRPQRREMTRKYKWREANVYFIDLHAAGSREIRDGDGTREYHVRWVVAGHWRQYPDGAIRDGGRVWKGNRAWVKSHVKGPAGAPWKGRGVHYEKDDDE